MAFSPYKRAPRLLSLFNVGPPECLPTVTSTWITKLPPDAKLCPKNYLSLGITAPPVTTSSSFIDHSIPKRKELNLPQELVDAAKSFSLSLSPNDEASVTKSSVINRTASPLRFIPPKKPIHPTCEDTLAALVTEPVNKKRTKRVKCEQVVSSHENEQGLQIVCWDPLANQVKEPDKKKRKIPPKVDCGPVVKNEVTERLQKFIIDELNGSDSKLVIQKVLFMSDLKPDQNRLNLPLKQLITEDFLTTEERSTLENEKEIEVRLVGPTLKMYKEPMGLKMWSMARTKNFVLKTKWKQFVEENQDYLKQLSMIQLWSFRKDQQLCFALAVVKGPSSGVNVVA